jgi:hypothetical protein
MDGGGLRSSVSNPNFSVALMAAECRTTVAGMVGTAAFVPISAIECVLTCAS